MGIVLGQGNKTQGFDPFPFKTIKTGIEQGITHLSRAIGAEIEEDHSIARRDRPVGNAGGRNEFIGNILGIVIL